MSNNGFVYMLRNEHMTVVKIGCTERSPHTRAEELSKSTGVPSPFIVVAYIEVPDFQAVERNFHLWLKDWRVTEGREFFESDCDGYALRLMYYHPKKLAFALCNDEFYGTSEDIAGSGPDPFDPVEAEKPQPDSVGQKLELVRDAEQAPKQAGGFE